jgi:hypothetical protein
MLPAVKYTLAGLSYINREKIDTIREGGEKIKFFETDLI